MKRNCKKPASKVVAYVILAILTLFTAIPFAWMLSASLKLNKDVFAWPMEWIPSNPRWKNYVDIWTKIPLLKFVSNTVYLTIVVTILQLLTSSFAAYAFSKLRFKGRNFLFLGYIATIAMPWQVYMVPQFIMMSGMGLNDKLLAMVCLQAFSAFGVFMMKQFYDGIPNDLCEAARIDGMTEYGIWWRIMVPLSKPSLATLTIFTFVNTWNDFLGPQLYLHTQEKKTLQLGLRMQLVVFKIITNMAMYKVGRAYDASGMEEGLELIDAYYDSGGWYHDENGGDKDYYNPFVMVTYGMIYAMFMQKEDPVRCARFRERALAFGKDYIYWFSENGESFAYGRSMTYRFAQTAYFSVCVLSGTEVFPLTVLKGIISRHLVYWLNQPIFDNAGVLTIGYCYPNLQMSESYNAPGSPYWAMKAFLFLALPEEHPYWRAPIAPLPELGSLKYLEHANMLIQRGDGNVVALVPGRTMADGHSHTIEKYAKFAYSSKFGFSIARSNVTLAENAPDSMLAFQVYGYFFVKNTIEKDYVIGENGLCVRWSPMEGIHVETTIEPTADGHIRTHRITSAVECTAYDCGFAVSTDDREWFTKEITEDSATVRNAGGFCMVRSLPSGGRADVMIPDPNTNLVASKTQIPLAEYRIRKGTQVIQTHVQYFSDHAAART